MAKGKGGNTVAVVERIARPVVEALATAVGCALRKRGAGSFFAGLHRQGWGYGHRGLRKGLRAPDPLIDEADPIEESYYFEVGSPGLGRRLTRPEHFAAVAPRRCW